MAVDVSKIPNNNKFDPVREAILQLQEDIQAEGQIAYDGEITVSKSTGSTITITNGSFSVNQSNNTNIIIGIDDSGYYSTSGGEIDGNVDITGNLVVEGNLTVSGDTITKLSEEVLIEDNIIILNSNEDGAPTLNSGIEIERGTSPNVDFLWNEASNEWDLQTSSGARIYRYGVGNTTLTIEAGSTAGDAVLALTPNTTGTGGVIQTTNERPIAFQPNSTTKMVIASGGDVNIYDSLAVGKTGAPSYELDVDGDGYFTGDVTATTFIGDLTGNADTATNANNADNADTVDNKHATDFDLQYVTDNGSLTDNPIAIASSAANLTALTLETSADSYVKQDFKTDTIGTSIAYLIAYGSANPQDGSFAIKNNANHETTNDTAGDIWFAANSAERLRIHGDTGQVTINQDLIVYDKVAIGQTDSASQALHIDGNIIVGGQSNGFIHGGGKVALSADGDILLVTDSNDTAGITPDGKIIFGGGSLVDTNGDQSFSFEDAFDTGVPRNEWARLIEGKFGIGETDPDTKIHIKEEGVAPVLLTLHNTQVSGDILNDGTTGNFIDFKSTDANVNFTPQVRIGMVVQDYSGNDGIESEGVGNFVVYTGQGTDELGNGTLTETFRVREDNGIQINGTTNNLILGEIADGTWHLRDTFQDNGIKIYSSTGGMEFQYNGVTEMTIDGNGVVFTGTVDLSDANLNIGSADIVFAIDATDTGARGLVWNFDADGNGTASNIGYIRAGGTLVGEVLQFNMNSEGTVTGSDSIYEFKNGGTDIFTIGADGDLVAQGNAYINGNQLVFTVAGGTVNGTITAAGGIAMNNTNLTGVNNIVINDAGAGEGIEWAGGNLWKIYESPNDLTNASGNLQFVTDATRRMTIDTSGNLDVTGTISGNGSGLTNVDAETLDGYSIEDIQKKGSDIGGSADLNNYIVDGYYHQNSNANAASGSNYPTALAGMLTVKSDGVMVYQTYQVYNDSTDTYRRGYYNGSWYSWKRILMDNDSINADTLDGLNSTQFLRSDADDTATGMITINSTGGGVLRLQNNDTSNAQNQTLGSIVWNNQDGSGTGPNNAAIIEAQTYGSAGAGANLLFKTVLATTEGGDATTGMTLFGNGDLTVVGNVGIGTTSPSEKLHIAGSDGDGVKITGGTNNRHILLTTSNLDFRATSTSGWAWGMRTYTNDGATLMNYVAGAYGDGPLSTDFQYNFYGGTAYNNAAIYIPASKNVGIGTTSPGQKLHVAGNIYATGQAQASNAIMKTYGGHAIFGSNSSTVPVALGRDANSLDLVVSASGNVGIGTTSPSTRLHVYHPSTNTVATFESGDAASYINIKDNASDTYGVMLRASGNNFGIHTGVATGSTLNERVTVLGSNGYVGIGTDNPQDMLHLKSTGDVQIRLEADTDNVGEDDNPSILLVQDGGAVSGRLNLSAGNSLQLINQYLGAVEIGQNNSPDFTIDNTGKFAFGSAISTASHFMQLYDDTPFICITNTAETLHGIRFEDAQATSTQNALFGYHCQTNHVELHINNTKRFQFNSDGNFHADNDITAFSTSVSDARLKDDIETIDNALDKVKSLRGVQYVWNKGSRKGQKDLGVVAQEVEQVLPEIVREKEMPLLDDSGEKYKTVDYEKMVGVLIEAIKEQQKQIDELKARLDGVTD